MLALSVGLTGEAMAARKQASTSKAGKPAKSVRASRSHKSAKKGLPSAKPRTSPSLFDQVLVVAESKASPDGKAILRTGKQMVDNGEVVKKGCWDYINKVYSRAGYSHKKRVVYFDSRKKGPYADLRDVQPGDWLYYVNHSYKNVEHSAIFIDWISRERNEALMLSYAGESKDQPARFKTYDLSSVYRIVRPGKPEPASRKSHSGKRVARK